ncbi:alpha/beta hydrolase [Notoacmeibacter sp. MSK16QG-6]|uniref:PHA/PHB synthase family protein n=1 Tax=Notoacmeibacter sp. MSK16QG-6 TaxID=2957982 RepID=UPI00209C72B8|nr:class I poly(R)-hydroxyalkanoic acid synthase [Notoacmeibacter sp. MSK16QG-6]MCP1199371.1 class I poly(R)-hydroxyalkanoic acid synthase [Notoacmeibacter sp. MSK16QG-6]
MGKGEDKKKQTPDEKQTSDEMKTMATQDPEAFARNIALAMENAGKAAAAWLRPREQHPENYVSETPEIVKETVETIMRVRHHFLADPVRAVDMQTRLMSSMLDVWSKNVSRLAGQTIEPEPEIQRDKRFAGDDWSGNPFYAFLRDSYFALDHWVKALVDDMEEMDATEKRKAEFLLGQVMNALSPSNFPLTNPTVMREMVESNGENLARGMKMLAEDVERGGGEIRLRQVDATPFKVGENIAVTPGKVVARNRLCEILQYEPRTQKVLKRPLVIVPPWINKFYILDLNKKKSFISWAVEQGHSVFVISWVNPDERHRNESWGNYARDGIGFALDTVEEITGADRMNMIGYCVGGTLLSSTLALLAQEGDKRPASATLFTTQVDFEFAGDLKIFATERQVCEIEQELDRTGYLAGDRMANAFNLLRSKELIWPYMVNNYMRGQDPMAFDLLYWNGDQTRMTAANHSFYLRNCYLENNLSAGRMKIDGRTISLSDIKVPIYNLATREDHIAPAKSVHKGSRLFGGPVQLVVSGSGHIAGVINPPASKKYQYWTNDAADFSESYDEWLAGASEHPGSWWPHWQAWIEGMSDKKVEAREVTGLGGEVLGNAPGSYVQMRI